jgi:hypothetical protein
MLQNKHNLQYPYNGSNNNNDDNGPYSDQRFTKITKQLQRAYQEKHMLIAEIQSLKDQVY